MVKQALAAAWCGLVGHGTQGFTIIHPTSSMVQCRLCDRPYPQFWCAEFVPTPAWWEAERDDGLCCLCGLPREKHPVRTYAHFQLLHDEAQRRELTRIVESQQRMVAV
jgi:hypothetical protein